MERQRKGKALMITEPDIKEIGSEYIEYLHDESRLQGNADTISFPETERELLDTLRLIYKNNMSITIQGGRTGIVGGAVPKAGHILNLEKMNKVTSLRYEETSDEFILTAQAGITLKDLNSMLETKSFDDRGWTEQSQRSLKKLYNGSAYFFPPDPTEDTASLGGMAAGNSSGARSYRYGPARNSIVGMRIVLPDGTILALKRGGQKASDNLFDLYAESGAVLSGYLPEYNFPSIKNNAGYYIKRDMDLIDLFIGSEGTLGVISDIEIRVLRKPLFTWGVMALFIKENDSIQFVSRLRSFSGPEVCAIEFFDKGSLLFLREYFTQDMNKYSAAIYYEIYGDSEDVLMEQVLNCSNIAAKYGAGDADIVLASSLKHIALLKELRHKVPENINRLVDEKRKSCSGITKLGTDMSVPDSMLYKTMLMYRSDLEKEKLSAYIFGHIGDNHLHVNIIPDSMEEYERGKDLYMKWADVIISAGGSVSAEHGIGKLKTDLLYKMYGEKTIAEMRELKHIFDRYGLLNKGNLFA